MSDAVLGFLFGISLILTANEGDAWWINIVGVILLALVAFILHLKNKK